MEKEPCLNCNDQASIDCDCIHDGKDGPCCYLYLDDGGPVVVMPEVPCPICGQTPLQEKLLRTVQQHQLEVEFAESI